MTAPPNPLIAERQDSTRIWSGITLVEGIVDAKNGIESGDWVAGSLGSLFVVVDAALLSLDPLGSVGSWVVAWVIEHVECLSEALDWLAGDPDQVAANAQTWANVSAHLMTVADDLRSAAWREVPHWVGPAADEYRAAIAREIVALEGFGQSAAAKAQAVQLSSSIVLLVRTLVRDLIADFVSFVALRLPGWLAEIGLTFGGATPWVAAQITALSAKWALKIARVIDDLIDSFRRLTMLIRQVDEFTMAIKLRPKGPFVIHTTPDVDGDGRPDALDPDRDGNRVLDDLNGDGLPDIPPPRSGFPDLPTKDMDPGHVGENVRPPFVKYLTPDELAPYRVVVIDGKLYKANGELLDTSNGSTFWGGSGRAIFVMDSQGNLYVSTTHAPGQFHHSSFLAGQPVAGAGEVVVKDGVLTTITPQSGHYQPTPEFQDQVLDQLGNQGVDVTNVQQLGWS